MELPRVSPSDQQDLAASPLEELCPGLTFQWLFNKRAFAFYAQHSSVHLVDIWFNKCVEIIQAWPENQPIFTLNDFSGKDCMTTPYNQQKNRELSKLVPPMGGFSAVVVRHSFSMQLSRLFVRILPSSHHVHLTFHRDEGLLWLKKQLDLHAQQPT